MLHCNFFNISFVLSPFPPLCRLRDLGYALLVLVLLSHSSTVLAIPSDITGPVGDYPWGIWVFAGHASVQSSV